MKTLVSTLVGLVNLHNFQLCLLHFISTDYPNSLNPLLIAVARDYAKSLAMTVLLVIHEVHCFTIT